MIQYNINIFYATEPGAQKKAGLRWQGGKRLDELRHGMASNASVVEVKRDVAPLVQAREWILDEADSKDLKSSTSGF